MQPSHLNIVASIARLAVWFGLVTVVVGQTPRGPELNPPESSTPLNSILRSTNWTPIEDDVPAAPEPEDEPDSAANQLPGDAPRELPGAPASTPLEELPSVEDDEETADDTDEPTRPEFEPLNSPPPRQETPARQPRRKGAASATQRRQQALERYLSPRTSSDAEALWGGKLPDFVGPQASDIEWNGEWLNRIDQYLAEREVTDTEQFDKLRDEFKRLQESISNERAARQVRIMRYRKELQAEKERRALEERNNRQRQVTELLQGQPAPASDPAHQTPAESSGAVGAPGGSHAPAGSAADHQDTGHAGSPGTTTPPSTTNEHAASPSAHPTGDSTVPSDVPAPADAHGPSGNAAHGDVTHAPTAPPAAAGNATKHTAAPTHADTSAHAGDGAEDAAHPTLSHEDSSTNSHGHGGASEGAGNDLPTYPAVPMTVDRAGLADNLFEIGETEKALEIYRQLLATRQAESDEGGSESLWYEYQIASCYRRLGNRSQAEKYFRMVAAAGRQDARLAEYAKWWLSSLESQSRMKQSLQDVEATILKLEEQLK